MKNLFISLGLIFLAVAERLWLDLGPNVELVTLMSVLASVYLGRRWGVAVALVALIISDLILGNTLIMLFTWSAFVLIAWGGQQVRHSPARAGIYGLLAALFFYLYTNFGVWLIGGLYPKTWLGLVECYLMGLPFFKIHAVSSVFLLGGSFALLNTKVLLNRFFRGVVANFLRATEAEKS